MKSLPFTSFLILSLLISPLKINGQSITEQQLQGSWVFDYEASMDLMGAKAKEHYEKMDASRQEKIQQAYQGRKIVFGLDGSFTQALSNGKVAEATWKLANGKFIEVSNSSGHTISFKIKKADGNVLLLIPQKPNGIEANMLFSQWYLIRDLN